MASLLDKVKKTNFSYLGDTATRYQHDPFNIVVNKDNNKIYFHFNHNSISISVDRLSHYTSKDNTEDLEAALKELKQPNDRFKRSYSELSGQVMLEAVLVNNVNDTLANDVLETLRTKANEVFNLLA